MFRKCHDSSLRTFQIYFSNFLAYSKFGSLSALFFISLFKFVASNRYPYTTYNRNNPTLVLILLKYLLSKMNDYTHMMMYVS